MQTLFWESDNIILISLIFSGTF